MSLQIIPSLSLTILRKFNGLSDGTATVELESAGRMPSRGDINDIWLDMVGWLETKVSTINVLNADGGTTVATRSTGLDGASIFDLAIDPANRLAEFEALIERTHAHGMQVIIEDYVYTNSRKLTLLMLNIFFSTLVGAVGVIAIIKLSLGA